jgi:hypothetical protein
MLGVNLNPAIIWNAIPWSFIVDFVLGVSQWVSQFKETNMEPVTVIHKYLYSVNMRRNIDITTTVKINASHVGTPSTHQVVNFEESAYRRVSGLPSITSALTSTGISPSEFAIGSALVINRLTR